MYILSGGYGYMSQLEFQHWLERHRRKFLKYEAWEVARLALACGFSMADIAPDLSLWVTASHRRLALWENPFCKHWLELWAYEKGHGWDEDM